MELCPGGSLTSWLKPEQRPSEERVRQVGVRIADALAAVHACGVLHRDVKPANILIDRYGEPRLADFGLAVVIGAKAAGALTATPAYAPPETFRMQPATAAGDVFSLAATLYALLAGHPPRQVSSAPVDLQQMVEIAQRPIDPLPGVDRCLLDVLMTALSLDPKARPTAAIFRDQLASAPTAHSKQPPVGAAEGRFVLRPSRFEVPVPAAHWSDRGTVVPAVPAGSPWPPDQLMSTDAPERRSRRRQVLLAAAATATVAAYATAWLVSGPGTPSAVPSASTVSAGPSRVPDQRPPNASTPRSTPRAADRAGAAPRAADRAGPALAAQTIQLKSSADSAKPFETVPIQGTYRGGKDTFLHVQRWEAGKWLAFPLPAKTDPSGAFNAYVELGQPSRYRLRVLDPDSGASSKPFVLIIKG